MDNAFTNKEYINKIHQYLDSDLNEKECMNFIKDVHSNPALGAVLKQERNLRTTIKNQLHRSKVSKDLIDSIKKKLY